MGGGSRGGADAQAGRGRGGDGEGWKRARAWERLRQGERDRRRGGEGGKEGLGGKHLPRQPADRLFGAEGDGSVRVERNQHRADRGVHRPPHVTDAQGMEEGGRRDLSQGDQVVEPLAALALPPLPRGGREQLKLVLREVEGLGEVWRRVEAREVDGASEPLLHKAEHPRVLI